MKNMFSFFSSKPNRADKEAEYLRSAKSRANLEYRMRQVESGLFCSGR